MPKGKIQHLKGKKSVNCRRKFKLGGRKNTVSALHLTTNDLLERFVKTQTGKDRQKIAQVLNQRGISNISSAYHATFSDPAE